MVKKWCKRGGEWRCTGKNSRWADYHTGQYMHWCVLMPVERMSLARGLRKVDVGIGSFFQTMFGSGPSL